MSGLNKAIIIGHLGQKPEVRFTPAGLAVTSFNVATNEEWTDKQGQKQTRTEWHRIVVWGKQAENCCKYLDKGKQVCVEGRLGTREWEDKDKTKRYTTEITAQAVQFLGSAGNGGGNRPPHPADQVGAPTTGPTNPQQPTQPENVGFDDGSDIPF